jgi:hypothetical protein
MQKINHCKKADACNSAYMTTCGSRTFRNAMAGMCMLAGTTTVMADPDEREGDGCLLV